MFLALTILPVEKSFLLYYFKPAVSMELIYSVLMYFFLVLQVLCVWFRGSVSCSSVLFLFLGSRESDELLPHRPSLLTSCPPTSQPHTLFSSSPSLSLSLPVNPHFFLSVSRVHILPAPKSHPRHSLPHLWRRRLGYRERIQQTIERKVDIQYR